MVRAVLTAERDGVPIRSLLVHLADEARRQRRHELEAAVRRLPVRLTFPLACCSLPAFVVLTVVPLAAAGLQRLGPVAVARAETAWLDGDPAAARGMVEDALDLTERMGGQAWPWLTGELAFWLWRLGGPDRLPNSGLPDAAAETFALQVTGDGAAAADL